MLPAPNSPAEISKKSLYKVIAIICIVYLCSYFHRVSSAIVALDIGRELGISASQTALFSSATLLAYGLAQLPSGVLSDRFGARNVLTVLIVLMSISNGYFALSSSLSEMVITRFILGFSIAVFIPSMTLLALYVPAHMFASVSGLLLCFGGVGILIAGQPLILVIDALGWRTALLAFSVFNLLLAVSMFFVVPKKEKQTTTDSEEKINVIGGIVFILKSKSFWPYAIWHSSITGTYFALATLWWAPYLLERYELSRTQLGFILNIVPIILVVSQPLAGYISDVVLKKRRILLQGITVIALCASLSMVLYTGQMSLWWIGIQTAFLALGFTGGTPLIFTMVKENFPKKYMGTATGCLNMFFPLWAACVQFGYGVIVDFGTAAQWETGIVYAMASLLIAINCAVALLVTFFMRDNYIGN